MTVWGTPNEEADLWLRDEWPTMAEDRCTCYSVETMEFDPAGPCERCRKRGAA